MVRAFFLRMRAMAWRTFNPASDYYFIFDKKLSETLEGFTLLKLVSNNLKTKKDKYY